MSSFHTQANLSQTLNAILLQHYNDLNKKEDQPTTSLPAFVLESLHQISFNLAGVVNNDFSNINYWRNISAYSELVQEILARQTASTNSINKGE